MLNKNVLSAANISCAYWIVSKLNVRKLSLIVSTNLLSDVSRLASLTLIPWANMGSGDRAGGKENGSPKLIFRQDKSRVASAAVGA